MVFFRNPISYLGVLTPRPSPSASSVILFRTLVRDILLEVMPLDINKFLILIWSVFSSSYSFRISSTEPCEDSCLEVDMRFWKMVDGGSGRRRELLAGEELGGGDIPIPDEQSYFMKVVISADSQPLRMGCWSNESFVLANRDSFKQTCLEQPCRGHFFGLSDYTLYFNYCFTLMGLFDFDLTVSIIPAELFLRLGSTLLSMTISSLSSLEHRLLHQLPTSPLLFFCTVYILIFKAEQCLGSVSCDY